MIPFRLEVKERIEGAVAEEAYFDEQGKMIGYWAYGSYDPNLPYQGMSLLKYRVRISIQYHHMPEFFVTTRYCDSLERAKWDRDVAMTLIEQATGGHIEKYVDGIGWVVCEEDVE